MAPLIRTTIARWAEALLHLQDSPPRLAAALAFGVAMGFTPFLGLQLAIAMTVAFVCGLNRVAVLAGLCANLPWIMVPWYAAATAVAAAAMGIPVPDHLGATLAVVLGHSPLTAAFWTALYETVRPWLAPFLLGPTIGGAILGLLTYPIALAVIRARRRRRARTSARLDDPALAGGGHGLHAARRPEPHDTPAASVEG